VYSERVIQIGGRIYLRHPDVDRYQIPFAELGDLRMGEVPPHSHVEILDLPEPSGAHGVECYAVNGGDEGDTKYLSIYGGASFKVALGDRARTMAKLARAFPDTDPFRESILPNPHISSRIEEDGMAVVSVYLNVDCRDRPDTYVRDAAQPFNDGFERLSRPSAHVFICHASEDKSIARDLAHALAKMGADVWFDEWEIRVGESIVAKIDAALGQVSHLVLLLSRVSVAKPWVQKEFSAALMRQLSANGMTVLPVRLDDCLVPAILADIRYADARPGLNCAARDLERAIFALPLEST
jgi:hypothetical protein